MNIDDKIYYTRQLFYDLRNCMTDEQLLKLATNIWENKSREDLEPGYFAECLANHIFEKLM